jgi:hypothetical protein
MCLASYKLLSQKAPELAHGWRRRLSTIKDKCSAWRGRFRSSKTSAPQRETGTACKAKKEAAEMSATQRIAAGLLLFASVVAIALARDFYQARTARARRAGRSLRKPVEPRRCTDSALTRRNSEEDLRQGAAAGLLMLSTGVSCTVLQWTQALPQQVSLPLPPPS